MDALPLTAETLLEHESFVRGVARGLLRDNDAVGDVVQETWLRGLEHRPNAGNLRGWLGRVAGNLARDRRRGTARRALREERAARSEAAESVHVSFERLSLQRDVVSAILALDEPYRSVVLLRYHHDLEPQAIAERLGVKPATVRTQLVRAHELLRAKLDSRYGRESWAALLLPIALPAPSGSAGAMTGVALGLGGALAALWVVISYGPAQREPVTTDGDEDLALLETEELEEGELGLDAGASARVPVTESPAPGAPIQANDGRETLGPRAELLARSRYDDYEKATFSFEFGLRDDPTQILGNDWDVEYTGREFDARTIVSDTSVIVDLGEVPVRDLWAWNGELGRPDERAPVRAGHTYFLWSRDRDTDVAVAFEVRELVPEDHCVLDWYATSDGQHARASFEDESPGKTLAQRLLALRSELRKPGELRVPHVLLQGRSANDGGNPHRVDIAGGTTYFDAFSAEALDIDAPLRRDEDSLAHSEGGFVPEGQAFVVTSAIYWARAPQAKGKEHDEAFALVIGGQRVVVDALVQPLSGTWVGRIEIPPGEEALTYLELEYESAGEVELFGELVERPGLIARARPSPPRQPRTPKPPPPVLSAPTVRLQGRNGAGGGNSFRVMMNGELRRFDTLSKTPLDLDAPIDINERGIAYCEGGVVPEGQCFVVTSVDYYGHAKGDGNGPGGFAVVVDGQRIVEHEGAEPISGTWRGRIEIVSLGGKRTYLELRNSSAGEAILHGEFVPAR